MADPSMEHSVRKIVVNMNIGDDENGGGDQDQRRRRCWTGGRQMWEDEP